MPARVHALLVVRPDARVATDIRLDRVLSALAAQARPVDTLTIVLCGPHATDRELQRIAGESAAEAVANEEQAGMYAGVWVPERTSGNRKTWAAAMQRLELIAGTAARPSQDLGVSA